MYSVYMHVNKTNGKKYVGLTCYPLERRWRSGCGYKNQPAMYNAIKKYGWDNFSHVILAEGLTHKEAKSLERYYIKSYKTTDKDYGYNITKGGEGASGRIVSEETRKQISESLKGIPLSEERKQKISKTLTGRKLSSETLQKYSDRMQGNQYSKGLVHSEEHKRKIKETLRSKENCRDILCIETGVIYECLTDAESDTGVNCGSIWACCTGKRKSAGGYRWKYVDKKAVA